MTVTETILQQSNVRPMTWRNDVALGLAGALLALCLQTAGGFPTLGAATGDNDSMLRLVEIRDLIGGQGWFDLHQYRMGPQGGFVMHWSRLVDAPIAAIILVVSAFSGRLATGETAAMLLWTTLRPAATPGSSHACIGFPGIRVRKLRSPATAAVLRSFTNRQ